MHRRRQTNWNPAAGRAFTIMELMVAMALMTILVAIAGFVFRHAVNAYRTASATSEIMRKYRAITSQLDTDLQGLRKDAEFIILWGPAPAMDSSGAVLDEDGNGVPDRYDSFDRLYFFASGNFQTYNEQPVTVGTPRIVYSNLARICYNFGREIVDAADVGSDIDVRGQKDYRKRMLCRTQHLVATDGDLVPNMPVYTAGTLPANWEAGWTANGFWTINNTYEYQSADLPTWLAYNDMTNPPNDWWTNVKCQMFSAILDVRFANSVLDEGGPRVDPEKGIYLHQLLSQGVGQFHIQFWRTDLGRWFPELDPNYDGNYSDADAGTDPQDGMGYYRDGNGIDVENLKGKVLFPSDDFDTETGSALKFTFTLYDSRGIFPEGKTFTHIVYLN